MQVRVFLAVLFLNPTEHQLLGSALAGDHFVERPLQILCTLLAALCTVVCGQPCFYGQHVVVVDYGGWGEENAACLGVDGLLHSGWG